VTKMGNDRDARLALLPGVADIVADLRSAIQ